jgi:hypothetical protein
MSPLPDNFNHKGVKTPRWLVLEELHGSPTGRVHAMLSGSLLTERQAKKIGEDIATRLQHSVIVVKENRGARSNPTLVHHGYAQRASWHLTTEHHAPLADLYFDSKDRAKKVAHVISDDLQTPVRLIKNDHIGEGQLSRHWPQDAVSPRAVANPGMTPARGEVWTRIGGGKCRVVDVKGDSITYLDLDSGNRVHSSVREFVATHRPPRTAPRINPGGRDYHPKQWKRSAIEYAVDHGLLEAAVRERRTARGLAKSKTRRNPRGGPRVVYNKLLGGWYVVTGPHQTPLNGRFNSKAEAQAWLAGGPARRSPNPRGRIYYIESRGWVHFVMSGTEAGRGKRLVVGTHGTLAAAERQRAELMAKGNPKGRIEPDGYVEITRAEWAKIHRDFKGKLEDGTLSAFGGALGLTGRNGGTTIHRVRIVDAGHRNPRGNPENQWLEIIHHGPGGAINLRSAAVKFAASWWAKPRRVAARSFVVSPDNQSAEFQITGGAGGVYVVRVGQNGYRIEKTAPHPNPKGRKERSWITEKAEYHRNMGREEFVEKMLEIMPAVGVLRTQLRIAAGKAWDREHATEARKMATERRTALEAFDAEFGKPNPKGRKFIAWVGSSSISVGETVAEVVASAREKIQHERWQRVRPGFPDIRVTTYGAQRAVQDHISSAPGANPRGRKRIDRAAFLAAAERLGRWSGVVDGTHAMVTQGDAGWFGYGTEDQFGPFYTAEQALDASIRAGGTNPLVNPKGRNPRPYPGEWSLTSHIPRPGHEFQTPVTLAALTKRASWKTVTDLSRSLERDLSGNVLGGNAVTAGRSNPRGRKARDEWAGWAAGDRFNLGIPISVDDLNLPEGSAGTLTLVSGPPIATAFAVFDSHPGHYPVPISIRWIVRHGVKPRRTSNPRAPGVVPMSYREAARHLGEDHVAHIVAKGPDEIRNRIWGAWTANRLESQSAYEAVLIHHFPAEHAADVESSRRSFAASMARRPKANPRVGKFKPDPSKLIVEFNRREVDEFRSRWPASGLPHKGITFAFHPGSLDFYDSSLSESDYDRVAGSGALPALIDDARALLRSSREPNPKGRNRGGRRARRGPRKAGARMNPSSEKERAAAQYRRWQDRPTAKARWTKMKGPTSVPKYLAGMGELVEVVYRSNKYDGKSKLYKHRTKSPRPVLATDPNGRHVFVVGGNMKVTPDGLVN